MKTSRKLSDRTLKRHARTRKACLAHVHSMMDSKTQTEEAGAQTETAAPMPTNGDILSGDSAEFTDHVEATVREAFDAFLKKRRQVQALARKHILASYEMNYIHVVEQDESLQLAAYKDACKIAYALEARLEHARLELKPLRAKVMNHLRTLEIE